MITMLDSEIQQKPSGVPFSFFCSLVREISKLPPVGLSKTRPSGNYLDYPAARVFSRWVEDLRRTFNPLPQNTTAICFRLLFPEEDVRRKYDIQETRMMQLLINCFGIDVNQLEKWKYDEASGCLGQELKLALERVSSNIEDSVNLLTIEILDQLLDELASKSSYSHPSVRSKYIEAQSRTRTDIFCSLFRYLPASEASVLVQIILKDLRPLLYPVTECHFTIALTKFNTTSVRMLTKEHAMDIWDPSTWMSKYYRVRSNLDEAADFTDRPNKSSRDLHPLVNIPVTIPKSAKGKSCKHAVELLNGSKRVWAETKYDGERAQIHVEILPNHSSRIRIFSKSQRDSTHDRYALHGIIRSSLGLEPSSKFQREGKRLSVTENVILDAEMVAFRGDNVDEFWHIRELIQQTALGPRSRQTHSITKFHNGKSDESDTMNLGLVFFDVISLNSISLCRQFYNCRREILEALIQPERGKAILADRQLVDMSALNPQYTLRKIFSERIADHQEGLILKAEDSQYNDCKMPWVKLKKDYIPGYGDTLDMVMFGASWEKCRARSLRVSPTTFTTFYIGALQNERPGEQERDIPQFHIYFTASYGLSRDQLEELNFFIKSSDPMAYPSATTKNDIPFKFTLFKGITPPTVIFRMPLLAEVFGAGFTKAACSEDYELRFPRINKYYRPSERSWTAAIDLQTLHSVACLSVGRDQSNKDIRDWCKNLWGMPTSPGVKSEREKRAKFWEEKLAYLDGKGFGQGRLIELIENTAGAKTNSAENVSQSWPPQFEQANGEARSRSQSMKIHSSKYVSHRKPCNVSLQPLVEVRLKKSFIWFARDKNKSCASCLSWKEAVSRERRLHSLQSLLAGCGWTSHGIGENNINNGVIVVGECGEDAEQWKTRILSVLEEIPRRKRVELVIYGCQSSEVQYRLR